MTYIKNLLHKIEDLSIGYHLPKFHILCQNSYRIATIIKLILEPFFSVKKATPRMFLKSAENRAASSLWVGGHRYMGIKLASISDLKLTNLELFPGFPGNSGNHGNPLNPSSNLA